jgi:hypothetical protein
MHARTSLLRTALICVRLLGTLDLDFFYSAPGRRDRLSALEVAMETVSSMPQISNNVIYHSLEQLFSKAFLFESRYVSCNPKH